MVLNTTLFDYPTRRFAEHYELVSLIGKGSFGEVWVCRERKSGKSFACKLIDKVSLRSTDEREDVKREFAILQAFTEQHQGIVQLKEVMEGERTVQGIMELCQGGDLFELLREHGRLPEAAAKVLFTQLASALAHCHKFGVVHRDIKPENILLSVPAEDLYAYREEQEPKPEVSTKLADFGLSVVVGADGKATGFTGSKYYTAPEMIKGVRYGPEVDVWSLGIVLCTMLTGRLPFAGKTKADNEGLRRAILVGRINFDQPSWEGVSEIAKDLVRGMVEVDPAYRLTSEGVLVHPWVASTSPMQEREQRGKQAKTSGTAASLPSSPVDSQRECIRRGSVHRQMQL